MKATRLLWEALVVEVLTAPAGTLRAVVPADGSAYRMRVAATAPGSASGGSSVTAWAICGADATCLAVAGLTTYRVGHRVSGSS
ncbi:hypothetical protein [Actinophytocola sp.]|uniref:hypothetical protein n=1 Tax=Actinophytocola sp. TaxID=1872138 RepID=UPI002D5CA551|nr:hypothetical protein [Actinophytocola sp.]HYQ68169.1 hypothetical protein [Actinophytocola sp.]